MFRLFDWECHDCGRVIEEMIDVPRDEDPPTTIQHPCICCDGPAIFERLFPLPAPYLGEKVHNYAQCGGSFDTMGHRKLPSLPTAPGMAEHRREVERFTATLPSDMAPEQRANEVFSQFEGKGPSGADLQDHFQTPAFKKAKAERKKVRAQNAEKKRRASAIAKGENVNMRYDKCAGDPDIMS